MICMLLMVAWKITTLLPGITITIILMDSMGKEGVMAIILLRMLPKLFLKSILGIILLLMGTTTRSIHAITMRHQCGEYTLLVPNTTILFPNSEMITIAAEYQLRTDLKNNIDTHLHRRHHHHHHHTHHDSSNVLNHTERTGRQG